VSASAAQLARARSGLDVPTMSSVGTVTIA
jgi:hypothetical protein